MVITTKQRRDFTSDNLVVEKTDDKVYFRSKADNCVVRESVSENFIYRHRSTVLDFMIERDIREPRMVGGKMYYGLSSKDGKVYAFAQIERGKFKWRSFCTGSKVSKGQDAYVPDTKESFEERALNVWANEKIYDLVNITNKDDKGFDIECRFSQKVKNEDVRGRIVEHHYDYPEEYGRGEWQANTIEDAMAMAKDYCTNLTKPMFSMNLCD